MAGSRFPRTLYQVEQDFTIPDILKGISPASVDIMKPVSEGALARRGCR